MSNLVQKVGDVTVITLAVTGCPPLPSERLPLDEFSRMLSAGERRFMLNLKQSGADSAMIGHVLMLWREIEREQGTLKIVVSKVMKNLLDSTQKCPFECFENEEEALATFSQPEE